MTKRKVLFPFAIPLTAEYFTLVEHVIKNKIENYKVLPLQYRRSSSDSVRNTCSGSLYILRRQIRKSADE